MRKLLINGLVAIVAVSVATSSYALHYGDGFLNDSSFAALVLGNNITIHDNDPTADGIGTGVEDDEVDYGAVEGQTWDLEGFFLNGLALTLVGGFPFQTGVDYDGFNYNSGDVFIGVDGSGIIGPAEPTGEARGFGYVLDVDWAALTYDIVSLTAGSVFTPVTSANRQGSNPFDYLSGGTILASGISLLDFEEGTLGNAAVGGLSDWGEASVAHSAAVFDLTALSDHLGWSDTTVDSGTTFHFTILCGNDGVNGYVPDGGTTIALLGIALMGLGYMGRKLT